MTLTSNPPIPEAASRATTPLAGAPPREPDLHPTHDAFRLATGKTAKIAIVDDEPINIKVLRKYLQGVGYNSFVTATESVSAMEMIRAEMPDIVLLDVMMPRVDGIQILTEIRADERLQHIPVLILTASTDAETKLRALNAGATDFLAKPVDASDLIPRIRNTLIVKAHHDHLASYSEQLERQVRVRTAELEVSRLQVIHCLARAAEHRDDATGRHVIRVGRYVSILAHEMGFSERAAAVMGMAAQLHDVGKIGVPDAILLKPARLTPDEFDVVKRHCDIGNRIVQPLSPEEWHALESCSDASPADAACQQPLLSLAARVAHSHHERWDGKGYPQGLAGDAIPIEGRITAVADVFDALSSPRPYKPAYPTAQCLEMMNENRGTQFDPNILDALLCRIEDILRVYHEQAEEAR